MTGLGIGVMWVALTYLRAEHDMPWTYIGWALVVTLLVLT